MERAENIAENEFKPPYNLSFRTLLNLLIRMEGEDPPPRIDRSYLGKMAGTDQTAVISALRGFGLIDANNVVRPELVTLAKNSEGRPKMMAALLERFYGPQVELSRKKATASMLEESFAEFGYSAETKRKAITFFLKATEYADLPLSPHFKIPKQRSPRTSRPRPPRKDSKSRSNAGGEVGSGTGRQQSHGGKGSSKTIPLRSGGEVTLAYTVDFFSLDPDDRDFVLGLIDSLRTYGVPQGAPEKGTGGQI